MYNCPFVDLHFSIDFFIPIPKIILELIVVVWHKMGAKDKK